MAWNVRITKKAEKPRTEDGLVTLKFMVHPANVERIKRFVAALEPDNGEEDSITAEMFFAKHFRDRSERAVILRGARHRENLTQAQLAELTGIPQRHISEMETEKRSIGKQRAKLIAKVLNIDYRLFL